MVDERNSIPVYALGGLCLAILMWVTYQKLTLLQEQTRVLAQQSLAKAGFDYLTAETRDSRLIVQGYVVDSQTAQAACKAAVDAVTGRIGIPGAFAKVDCQAIRYPASTAVPAPSVNSATKSVDPAKLSCQNRLDAAGRSGTIQFEKGKSMVAGGQSVIDKVAEAAKACRAYKIEVGSHTDTGGPSALNLALSVARADGVREALIAKGVSADQITAKGYGESQPLVNDFPDGKSDVPGQPDTALRQKNRRIEFRVISPE